MEKFGNIVPGRTPDVWSDKPVGREKTAAELDDGLVAKLATEVESRTKPATPVATPSPPSPNATR